MDTGAQRWLIQLTGMVWATGYGLGRRVWFGPQGMVWATGYGLGHREAVQIVLQVVCVVWLLGRGTV